MHAAIVGKLVIHIPCKGVAHRASHAGTHLPRSAHSVFQIALLLVCTLVVDKVRQVIKRAALHPVPGRSFHSKTDAEGVLFERTHYEAQFHVDAIARYLLVIVECIVTLDVLTVCVVVAVELGIFRPRAVINVVKSEVQSHIGTILEVCTEVHIIALQASCRVTCVETALSAELVIVGSCLVGIGFVTVDRRQIAVVNCHSCQIIIGVKAVRSQLSHLVHLAQSVQTGIVGIEVIVAVGLLLIVESHVEEGTSLIGQPHAIHKTHLIKGACTAVLGADACVVPLSSKGESDIALAIETYASGVPAHHTQVGTQSAHRSSHTHIASCAYHILRVVGKLLVDECILCLHACCCQQHEGGHINSSHKLYTLLGLSFDSILNVLSGTSA